MTWFWNGDEYSAKLDLLWNKEENLQSYVNWGPLGGGGGGGEGGTYVPSLNFKYGCFTFWGVGHVPVGT